MYILSLIFVVDTLHKISFIFSQLIKKETKCSRSVIFCSDLTCTINEKEKIFMEISKYSRFASHFFKGAFVQA